MIYRGIVVCLLSLLVAGTAFAGVSQTELAVDATLNTSKVEMLLPPGTDLAGVRGSLSVERFPVTHRTLADGTQVKTLPVVYTFVNHWNETFMFDGYNEAVLTDYVGNQHFASAVVRNNRLMAAGVSGLIPSGHTIEFTAFYDLDPAHSESNLEELKLDLRYLNHGHPFQVSAIVSAYASMPLASGAWQVAGEPGVEERPEVVPVAKPQPAPVQPKPEPIVSTPPPAPQPKPVQPEPVIVEKPQPVAPPVVAPPVVAPPVVAPPVVAPPVVTPPVAPIAPPAPVLAGEPGQAPAPIQLSPGSCNPSCAPCCICIPLPNVGGFVCCVFDKVGNLVCCTTNGACGLVHNSLCLADNLVCQTLQLACCVTKQTLNGTCGMLNNVLCCVKGAVPCGNGGCNLQLPNVCGIVNGVGGVVNQVVCTALSPLSCLNGNGACGLF